MCICTANCAQIQHSAVVQLHVQYVAHEKGPMSSTHYFVLRQGGEWIFAAPLHFTMKMYIITTFNRILHTNTPSQCKLISI